jgi:hypothetical protein
MSTNNYKKNYMVTPVTDSKTAPQSYQGYQRSIAQPSPAADNNTPKKATTTTAKGRRRRRHSRAMRKSRRRGRRGTRRR